MRRARRLLAFAVVVSLAVGGLVFVFRGQLMRAAGVSFDTGAPGLTTLHLPAGYTAAPFATGLSSPRFMATSPAGVLFVADRLADRIVALPDANGDGRADRTVAVGSGYGLAHSLAFVDAHTLLVAGTTTLWRVTIGDDLVEQTRTAVLSGLPGDGAHTTKTVVIRPDGSVLLSVGSSCNVCLESDDRRAAILLVDPGVGRARVFMRGLRNAVGLAVDPATGAVWADVMGRDLIGDDRPPETLYRVVDGADGGWPRCHAGTIVDPDFGGTASPVSGATGCDGVAMPAAMFQAHAAPLGIAFWHGHAVIAFHGSWNRSSKVGYEVDWLPWADGPAGPAEPFATGFLDAFTTESTGRPAGVIVGGTARCTCPTTRRATSTGSSARSAPRGSAAGAPAGHHRPMTTTLPSLPPRGDLRARVLAGEPTLGAFVTFGSVISAELLGRSGFDWLIVDQEHGHFSDADLLPQLHAVQLSSTAGLVRVASGEHCASDGRSTWVPMG